MKDRQMVSKPRQSPERNDTDYSFFGHCFASRISKSAKNVKENKND
jgi:hypothetical protein